MVNAQPDISGASIYADLLSGIMNPNKQIVSVKLKCHFKENPVQLHSSIITINHKAVVK